MTTGLNHAGEPPPDGVIAVGNRVVVERRGIDLIPADERRGVPRHIGLMWSGAVLNVPVLVSGALLAMLGLDWQQCIAAVVVGNLSWLLTGVCSLAGRAAGTTTFAINRAPFGQRGNRPIAAFNWIMQLGYEVLNLVLMSLAVAALFGLAGQELPTPATIAVVLVLAVIQSIAPIVGHAAIITMLRALVAPFAMLFLMLAWLTSAKLELTSAAPAGWAVFFGGVGLVASASGLGWCPNAADYSRYLPAETSGRALVGWVFIGGAIPQSLLMLLGAAVASVVPLAKDPIGGVPAGYPVWFVIPYFVLLIVQMIMINAVDLYSSGVTLQAIGIRISRWRAVALDGVICAIVGLLVVLSGSLTSFIHDFLLVMIVWLGPWVAVFVTDYALRRGSYHPSVLGESGRGFSPAALAAQLAGMAAAVLWLNTTVFVGPLAAATGGLDLSAPAGLAVAGFTYYLMARSEFAKETIR